MIYYFQGGAVKEINIDGKIVFINYENSREITHRCTNLAIIEVGSISDLRALDLARIDLIIIDVDNTVDFDPQLLACYVSDVEVRICFTSQARKKLRSYEKYGNTIFKHTPIIVDYIVQTLIERKRIQDTNIVFDYKLRSVYFRGELIKLRNSAFLILKYLVENANITCTREELMKQTGNGHSFGDSRTVDVHINYLRKRIDGIKIVTVLNKGYVYVPDNDE